MYPAVCAICQSEIDNEWLIPCRSENWLGYVVSAVHERNSIGSNHIIVLCVCTTHAELVTLIVAIVRNRDCT